MPSILSLVFIWSEFFILRQNICSNHSVSHFIYYWTLNYWRQIFERIIVFSSFQIFWISSNSQECCCLRKICSNKAAREINKGHNFFKPNMLDILAKTGTFRFKIVCFSDRNSEGILIHEKLGFAEKELCNFKAGVLFNVDCLFIC